MNRDDLLDQAHLEPPLTIAGRTLRPFGLTSFVLLKRLGNRLVCGGVATVEDGQRREVIDFSDPENITAVLEFLYVHSAPIGEVLRASRDRQTFDEAVLMGTADISVGLLTAAVAEITRTIEQASAAAVVAQPKDTEPHDPNGPGPRG